MPIKTANDLDIPACSMCGDENCINDAHWGWICADCKDEYDEIERTTDWDAYEERKRRRIEESNEY
ncbi:hypothetical protein HC752_21970 [Vibrio sp. S9_S30]|uniref:hypothetical protein n=1 Tax=Vibrio sp. S9_S30 TaxID=2720226 RepID=UPI001680A3CF|nr:hypothetical protein [Vibrio sp. S9_S30]MBD1559615.1 hypothetical protein [Vibrio sp. S9_S30]